MPAFIEIVGPMLPFGLFCLFLPVVILLAILGHKKNKERKLAMANWAHAKGLTFDPSHDSSFDERWPEFDCLRRGSDRYAFNIMAGVWEGRALTAFDYHYETSSTDSKGRRKTTHHYFSAIILRANIPLKPLQIRPENFFDRIGSVFGFDDIDFESAEFSRRFKVNAPDRKWAYDVLHAKAMTFMLQHGKAYSIEFDRQHVIAVRNRRLDVAGFEHAVYLIDHLLDLLPEYVRQQQQQQTPADPFA